MDRRSPRRTPTRLCIALLAALTAVLCVVTQATAYTPAVPIAIRSDAEFTSENGVLSGSGTTDDPFVISNLEIDASAVPYGILVENTTAAFQVENCHIIGAVSAAVRLIATQSASVMRCTIEGSDTAIQLLEVSGARITENEIVGCKHAILLQLASANEIAFNRASEGLLGLALESWSEDNIIRDNALDCTVSFAITEDCNRNALYRNDFYGTWLNCDAFADWASPESEGNYWGGYQGEDVDGDGVGDTAYSIPGVGRQRDSHPAISPYHLPAEQDSKEE